MTSTANFSPSRGNDSNWSTNAPVCSLEFPDEGLPYVWITYQNVEPTLEVTGRDCWHSYPGALVGEELEPDLNDWFGTEADPDEDGNLALHYGAQYYDEAMNTQDEAFHQDRIDCFRAAEALFLWGASKGNAQAYVNLGYVYSYDRCEGQYLGMDEHGTWIRKDDEPFPRERRAYECFASAAKLGHPNACYKLGDLVRDGRGCEPSLKRAVELWERGYRLSSKYNVPVWWGASALRLGHAHEYGEGCIQDFAEALTWYERAETGLRIAVDQGDWYYRAALRQATDGVTRCRQELSGAY